MEKTAIGISNDFCPQTLFLYGTYKEDGTPNFALFSWLSYCWDGGLSVMAAIGDEKRKLTKDRIRAGHVFSANLVSEPLLPVADYLGNTDGYAAGKMDIPLAIERGSALPVPVLSDSPWSYELEVTKTIPLDGSEVYLCRIHAVQAAKALMDEQQTLEARMAIAAPVLAIGLEHYFPLSKKTLGAWGDWKTLKQA